MDNKVVICDTAATASDVIVEGHKQRMPSVKDHYLTGF